MGLFFLPILDVLARVKSYDYGFSNQAVVMDEDITIRFAYEGNLPGMKQVINGKTIYPVYSAAGPGIRIENFSM